jgi:DNA-binding MarR family transcriptional regulator
MMDGMTPTPDAAAAAAANTAADAAADAAAIAELSALTLPLMWSLRQEAMRVFEPLGLRPTRVLLLELVARGIDRPGNLADVLDTVPPAVTAMLNELTRLGSLARDADPDDRRRARLRLTPAGDALLELARERWREASATRLARVDRDDLAALLRAFRTFIAEEAA